MAESLDIIATELETAVAKGRKLNAALAALLPRLVKENKGIIFNGNGYSEEWYKEAEKRKLLNHRTTPEALPELVKPAAVKVFEKYGVLSEREIRARYEVDLEAYCKTLNIEVQLMVLIANRYIFPAGVRYQTQLAQSLAAVKAAGGASKATKQVLDELSANLDRFKTRTKALQALVENHNGGSLESHAGHFCEKVIPAMASLREVGDAIELIVPSDMWPLPTYREMLFVK